jgi:hypothetical protein
MFELLALVLLLWGIVILVWLLKGPRNFEWKLSFESE